MTHGHIQRVKSGFYSLVRDAQAANVQAVLFGYTHEAYCDRTESGMWVVNPGSCGYYGGTAALIDVADKKISDCRIIGQSDLEALTVGTETQVR
jgi:predicted phosphodiesterase